MTVRLLTRDQGALGLGILMKLFIGTVAVAAVGTGAVLGATNTTSTPTAAAQTMPPAAATAPMPAAPPSAAETPQPAAPPRDGATESATAESEFVTEAPLASRGPATVVLAATDDDADDNSDHDSGEDGSKDEARTQPAAATTTRSPRPVPAQQQPATATRSPAGAATADDVRRAARSYVAMYGKGAHIVRLTVTRSGKGWTATAVDNLGATWTIEVDAQGNTIGGSTRAAAAVAPTSSPSARGHDDDADEHDSDDHERADHGSDDRLQQGDDHSDESPDSDDHEDH